MYRKDKPMLTSSELITHLEMRGVKFERISKDDAEKYLEENNNYFRVGAYRKNFPKYEEGKRKGKYIDLDFKMLIDLSVIDMRIRKTMLSIVLDVEHYAKVRLLAAVKDNGEDGYTIVEEYVSDLKSKNDYKYLENELNRNRKGVYCGDLVAKYCDECPVWVFVEIISLGRLIEFYRFVAEKLRNKEMINESYLLRDVRELRNACAHNNCIINDLRSNTAKHSPNYDVLNSIAGIGISKKVRDNKLSNSRIKQLVTLLYLDKNITSSRAVFSNHISMLQELKERIERNNGYYTSNQLINGNFEFLNKIIDNWYNNSV